MSFYQLYNAVSESHEDFYVGKILVSLAEVSEEAYNEAVAAPNVRSMKEPTVDPAVMKKWRATYTVNGKPITNYLTAANKNEAKQMLYEFLRVPNGTKKEIVRSSEFAPVDNWDELIRLLQYSMSYDRKNRRNGASPFGSLDVGDFHLMLLLVKKHPNFVKTHLAALDPKLQFYFKSAYNGLSKRDLDKDLDTHWGSQVKGIMSQHGDTIRDRMAPLKTRNSPQKPSPPSTIPIRGSLGLGDQRQDIRPAMQRRMP